uniref:Ci-LF-5/6 receptor n=2 Tax=Ciona intestinalis TaxID=7719 RepID=A0A1W2WNF0_CIOIN|nr:octopamine receptor beta-2R-like [Ciona intestinalis]BBC53703.1 Ci-LF-5/6 receptor [Ciona intestinalis]|eukprot:XP_002131825.2 octopamine receptor beta-2R-like [Ciona intestinalis]
MTKLGVLLLSACMFVSFRDVESINTAVVAGQQFLHYTLEKNVNNFNETERNKTCSMFIKDFRKFWYNSSGGKYLTEYLSFLEEWLCHAQFSLECLKRPYDFNQFTKTTYDRACNRSVFETQCFSSLVAVSSVRGRNSSQKWNNLLRALKTYQLSDAELQDPCIQVALYDAVVLERGKYGYYHESKRLLLPFCQISWCGRDAENINRNPIKAWNCLPHICKVNIIITMVICSILAVAIVVANLSVILVFVINEKLRNSQGVYKISLACADFLVGAIVLPSFPISLSMQLHTNEGMGSEYNVTNLTTAGLRFDEVPHLPGAYEMFNKSYLNAIGFFTTTSFIISIYSLMVASFDRFSIVRKPLAYSKDGAKLLAIRATVILWVLSIILGILPLFIGPSLRYGLVASTLISTSGTASLYFYVVALAFPLIVMWVLSISTFVMTVRHNNRTRKLVASKNKTLSSRTEIRMARTLGIMVGVFTLSLLPVICVILASLFLVQIYPQRISSFRIHDFSIHNSFEFVSAVILVCNSLWNFFIYNGRNDDFRMANKNMYGSLTKRFHLPAKISVTSRSWTPKAERRNITSETSKQPSSQQTDTATPSNGKKNFSTVQLDNSSVMSAPVTSKL